MLYTVAIAGASGYAGGELIRLLSQHPHMRVTTLTAAASAGSALSQTHPHLRSFTGGIKETSSAALSGHDVVFLALPHGKGGDLAAQIEAGLIIDCSADHRLMSSQDWDKYYGGPYWGCWEYGIPELLLSRDNLSKQRNNLLGAKRIAAPGCNASAGILALAPGLWAGLLEADITVTAIVGSSGAGKALRADLQASELLGSAHTYAVGGKHRHIPEILQGLQPLAGGNISLSFTPVLVPLSRGIMVVASARIKQGDRAKVYDIWQKAYAEEKFVTVLPLGTMPRVADVVGSNSVLIGLEVDANRLLVVCVIDNLVKGTAGAAIQSANIALGLAEETALPVDALAP